MIMSRCGFATQTEGEKKKDTNKPDEVVSSCGQLPPIVCVLLPQTKRLMEAAWSNACGSGVCVV